MKRVTAIRLRISDTDPTFVNLEPQGALLVIIGLLAQLRELDGIGQQDYKGVVQAPLGSP